MTGSIVTHFKKNIEIGIQNMYECYGWVKIVQIYCEKPFIPVNNIFVHILGFFMLLYTYIFAAASAQIYSNFRISFELHRVLE